MHPRKKDDVAGLEDASYRELRLLQEVNSTPEVSQRRLAFRMGVALGVANLLVKSLATKGYLRASQVGWQRWVYILTPAGIRRHLHLTLAYINRVLDHYQRVRRLLREDLRALTMNPDSHVAIYGTTELAELVYLALREIGVTKIDFFAKDNLEATFLGVPIRDIDAITESDYVKVIVAFSNDVQSRCQELHASGVHTSRIVTPLQSFAVGSSIDNPGGKT